MELMPDTMTIRDLLELKKSDFLKVNSEYQRAAVWSDNQQKKLIDSVMRGYPLPLIYLHRKKKVIHDIQNVTLEIIDGQQRINALYRFGESALKLFDPIKDDKIARFPNFLKNLPCEWAGCNFLALSSDLKDRFLNTKVFIVEITTDIEDEARDLFIRLQAGLPLNAQEKRDAWPGSFTELVLKLGGKQEIVRYQGHDFFQKVVKKNKKDRGEVRQLCAQICMLFFERSAHGSLIDIGTQQVDDYYYRNLDFDLNSSHVSQLLKTIDLAVQLFANQTFPKLKGHEAIHIVLLLDSLRAEYAKGWQSRFIAAYDSFKAKAARDKKEGTGEYWFEYGALTQTQSDQARTIQRRHLFFAKKMLEELKPTRLDPNRSFGMLEREIVYFRDSKCCAICKKEIPWADLEIHHVEEHQTGGLTTPENAVSVHKTCHPKGQNAVEFKKQWEKQKEINEFLDGLDQEPDEHASSQ